MDELLMDKIEKILSIFDDVEFAYLFGSYATKTASNHSDIDIAIYIKDGLDRFDIGLKVHHELEISLSMDVDVVILNDLKNLRLLKDILYKGLLLKDSENRPIYEVRKQHEIIDFFDFKRILDVA